MVFFQNCDAPKPTWGLSQPDRFGAAFVPSVVPGDTFSI